MNDDISNHINVIHDHFIRLRFGISHIKTNYEKKSEKWELKDSFNKAFDGKVSCLYFDHIDLTLKQDCVLSICRLLDKRTDVIALESLLRLVDTNEDLIKEYNSIRGLSEFRKIKQLRDKKLSHIADNKVDRAANENDLITVSERLEILYEQTRFQIFGKTNTSTYPIEEIMQSATKFWAKVIIT